MITESIEIGRTPEDVFAYLDEIDRHHEWQTAILATRIETEGPVGVGTRVTETRRVPGGRRELTYEITGHEPPRHVSFRGLSGPVRPIGTITIEPLAEGARSRLTLVFDLQGHGVGKLLAPIARRAARKSIPADQARLKERLESGL